MKIAYIGRVSLSILSDRMAFDRPFPAVKWGFPLGTEIVCGLVARGHHVSVIVCDNQIETICVYHALNCAVYIVPDRKRTRWQCLTLFSKEVHGILKSLSEINPDVVFAQWTYYNAYAGLRSGVPTLVVAHDSPWRVFQMQPNALTLIKALYAQFRVFPVMKHVSAVSPYIVDELHGFRWLRRRDIPVIPNGVPIGDVKRRCDRGRNTGRGRTIVCVSEWGRLKNVNTLLQAFVDLRRRHGDWRLVLIGSWLDDSRGAGEWMRRRGLSADGIEFRGIQPHMEVLRVFRDEADLFVSPSLEESFGMVFVEAMRFGVPCIGGGDSGAVPWVIGDESGGLHGDELRGGVVCDVRHPYRLADCIERVFEDDDLLVRLSEGGRRRVRTMFNIEKTVDAYEMELERIARPC